jgi:hypothetical protein
MNYKPKSGVLYNKREVKEGEGNVAETQYYSGFEIESEEALFDWYKSLHPEMVAERFTVQGSPEDHAYSMIIQYDQQALGTLSDSDHNLGKGQDYDQPRNSVMDTIDLT